MFYKFVEAINPITNPQDIRMPAGLYAGILVRWEGTAQTAQTLAQTDFGTILVRHRGRNIVNARARDLYVWSELAGGYADWHSAAAGVFHLVVFVPFRYGEMPGGSDDNLLNCGPDELFISIPALSVVKALTCTCQVGWVSAPGVARYIPQITTQSLAISLNQPVELGIPNLQDLMIDDAQLTTEPTEVFLTRNGKVIFEGPYIDLQSFSDMAWYREAVGIDACMIRLGRDDFASFVGGRYDLRLIGGVGTAHILELGALPVSSAEYQAVKAVQEAGIAEQYSASPEPPAADVAPATAETANAAAGMTATNRMTTSVQRTYASDIRRRSDAVVAGPGVFPAPDNRFVGPYRVGL
jgi:hypothetical protein